jgi:hypothetical protein
MIKAAARKFKLEPKLNSPYSAAVEKLFEENADEMSL